MDAILNFKMTLLWNLFLDPEKFEVMMGKFMDEMRAMDLDSPWFHFISDLSAKTLGDYIQKSDMKTFKKMILWTSLYEYTLNYVQERLSIPIDTNVPLYFTYFLTKMLNTHERHNIRKIYYSENPIIENVNR
jgi:hypothetical protein